MRSLSGAAELIDPVGPSSLLGRPLPRLLPPAGREALRQLLTQVLQLGIPLQTHLQLQEGAPPLPVLLAPVPTGGGIDELLLIAPWRGGSAARLQQPFDPPTDQGWVVGEAPIGIILVDGRGTILRANSIATLLLELDEGIDGLQLGDVPALQRTGLAKDLLEVVASRRNVSRPLVIGGSATSGESASPTVWCSTAVQLDPFGHVTAVALYLVDQLPLALMEADLDRNRQLLDLLVEESDQAITVVDRLGRVLRCNTTAVAMLDLPRESLLHQPIQELLREPSGEVLALGRILALSEGERLEVYIARAGGATTPALVRCRCLAREQLQLVFTDLSAQARLQDALEASRQALRTLLEAAPGALALINVSGMVEDANAPMLQLLGIPASSVIGAPLATIAAQLPLPQVQQARGLESSIAELLRPDGRRVVHLPLIPPAPGHRADLQLIRLQGTLPHEPLVLLAVDLAGAGSWGERDALMPSLAALIDESLRYLNDPLLKMVLLSENARETSPRFLEGLDAQYQLAHSLLARLRRLCNVLTRQPLLSDARVAVREGIAAATVGWPESAPVVVEPSRPVPVRADASQLSLIVEELVRNGLEATGGLDGEVTVLLRVEDGAAVLLVRDSGPGFDPAQIPIPFAPFHSTRLDRHTTVRGLGLCSAAVVANRLGAQLRLLPQGGGGDDSGTQWQLRLPLSPLRSSADDDGAPSRLGGGDGRTVH